MDKIPQDNSFKQKQGYISKSRNSGDWQNENQNNYDKQIFPLNF